MTKSNARAVRRRRTNQLLARQYDEIQQLQPRAYQQNSRVRDPERKIARQWIAEMGRRIVRNFTRWVKRFSKRSNKLLVSLDLRSKDAERFGPFDPARKRNAGAAYLRSLGLPELNSRRKVRLGRGRYKWIRMGMVSTRDGRRV